MRLIIVQKFLKSISTSILVLVSLFLITKSVYASEGKVELRSTTGEDYKCLAVSLRMQNLEHRIPFSCRNLIYPAGENIFNYVMWATPSNGGTTLKLGALGLGKGEFKTKTSFRELFVTTESSKNVKTPSGTVVMRGNLEPWEFLESQTTPTPTLTPAPGEEEQQPEGQEGGQAQDGQEGEQQQLTTRQKLILALQRAGIAALFALVALIGIIFVVSRSRG